MADALKADEQIEEEICEHNDCRRTIFVRSVPHAIRRKELTEFFSTFGQLSKVSIHTNCKTRKSKGTAQIQFRELENAENVLKLSDDELKFRDRMLKPVPSRCQRVWKYETSNKDEVKAMTSSSSSIDVHESECYINSLPIELLNYIFSFLDFKERIRVEIICKLWHHLSSTIPWANMYSLVLSDSLFQTRQKLNSSILENILSRCGSTLRTLDLSLCEHQSLSLQFPIIIANHCPNLEEINLHGRRISCKALGILAASCQKLRKVDLSRSNACDKWVTKLLRHCKVTELNLSQLSQFSGKNFHHLSNGIRVLHLSNCNALYPGVLDYVSKHKTIAELYLNSCSSLSQSSVRNMFKCLGTSLKVLEMGGYFPELTLADFNYGLAKCTVLEQLSLEANSFVDDSTVKIMATKCLRLRSLNVSSLYVTDEGLLLLSKLDDLRHLYINYNDKITNNALKELSMKGLLRTLELRGCEGVGDEGCNSVLTNCKGLQLLDVSSCPLITNDAFAYILSPNWATTAHLKIFVGGTDVTNFAKLANVEICEMNRCPRDHRPWGMVYNYEDNDYDWGFELDNVDEDFYDDYDDYEDYDDYDADDWEFDYIYDQILDDPALYYDVDG